MPKTLREIADLIGAEVVGDENVCIHGFAGIREAGEGDITFLANPKYFPLAKKTKASAIIVSPEVETSFRPLLVSDNPSVAFIKIVSLMNPAPAVRKKGVHPSALIGKDVSLGKDVYVGPYVVVEDKVVVGDQSSISAGCFVGESSKIGKAVFIHPNVSIRERVSIGDRVVIHSGTVLGSDGFGFTTIDKTHYKIPQMGTVEIGDDVEIGANVSIDRARFDKTVIGKGTKIDNLVHIAHNVIIGENCLIVAQVGVSGSTSIGNNVTLAGQVGIVGHIDIGDNVVVMAQSGVSKSIPADTMVWGYPAKPDTLAKRINACVQNLPRLYETVAQLKKQLEEMSGKKKEED